MLQRLRERSPDLPEIALSGYGAESDLAASRDAGFAAHIVKPVDLDKFVDSIRRLPVM